MLEKLVAWILNSYLGDYLELNTDQLSVGILSGQVELENIPLKSSAFEKYDLPLEVKSGLVGKIKLSIPVAGLSSQPWVIEVSNVYVVVKPRPHYQYDEESIKAWSAENKKCLLQDLENSWKLERQPSKPANSSYSSWMSYGTGIATNIMENLQLKLLKLHIRYESEGSHDASAFSFGITIDKLAAQSTDQNWVPQYVSSSTGSVVHKMVELVGMSLYWDHHNTTVSEALSLKEQLDDMEHNYLLQPVTGKALVKQNTSVQPLKSSEPRINIELQFDCFLLSLDNLQYRGLAVLLREFELYEQRKPYRRTRPAWPVHNNCRVWWNHAIQSTVSKIRERNEKCSKDYILNRCKDCVSYVNIYYQILTDERISYHLNKEKENIERDLEFETLKVLRQLAAAKVKNDGLWYQQTNTSPQASSGYLSSWITWYSAKPSSDSPASAGAIDQDQLALDPLAARGTPGTHPTDSQGLTLTSTEKAKLEEELRDWVGGNEPVESQSTLNKDSVLLNISFVLRQVNFKLVQQSVDVHQGTNPQGIVQLECHNIRSTAVLKPRTKSRKLSLALGQLYVKDLYNTTTHFPLLISSKQAILGSSLGFPSSAQVDKETSRVFYFEIEKNAGASSKDIRVLMNTDPLDIVYNEAVVKQVKQFFSPKSRINSMTKEMSEFHLADRARRRYEQLKNKTKIDIRDTWENLLNTSTVKSSKRVGVKLNIAAPQFIIPQDWADSRTPMVVFDLGRLKVNNLPDSSENVCSMAELNMSSHASPSKEQLDDGDDDDFVTPMSTPPDTDSDATNKTEISGVPSLTQLESELNNESLYTHMYDRYEILLADIQVLIVNRKDNWRMLTSKGYGHLHLIDKLSVNVLFERRLLLTADPHWPAIKLSAIIESLSVHVSELKLFQLNSCLQQLMAGSKNAAGTNSFTAASTSTSNSDGQADDFQAFMPHSSSRFFAPPETRTVLDNSKIVTLGFDIHQMSLDVTSKERCLVELQVAGVKADFTQLPSQSDLSLTVHSLIVADALQSYGPDFELLVASHRNVGLDSKSGSMCSSAVMSPISPKSPHSPRSPTRSPDPESYPLPPRKQTSYTSFQTAVLSGIQKLLPVATATPLVDHKASYTGNLTSAPTSTEHRPISPVFQGEPLIKVTYVQTGAEGGESVASKSVDIVFNTLDVVANQQTMVEVVAFINNVLASSNTTSPNRDTPKSPTQLHTSKPSVPEVSDEQTAEASLVVQAEFKKLNILLHCPRAYRSASLTNVSYAPISTSVSKVAMVSMMGAKIEAAMGGNSATTIEAELGGLQVTDLSSDSVHTHVFAFGNTGEEQLSCLEQSIPAHMYQTCAGELSTLVGRKAFNMTYSQADDVVPSDSVTIQIGSIQYIHVSSFLSDLSKSVNLFQEYIEKAKQKIKHAASEAAESFVHQKTSQLKPELLFDMDMSLTLDAPLIVLPCTTSSTQVLVGELGKMTVTNKREVQTMPPSASDIISIQIRDMKLVTKDVDPLKTTLFGQEVILDEAGVNMTIVHKQVSEAQNDITGVGEFLMEISTHEEINHRAETRRYLDMSADIPHALQLSLSRQAYELTQQAIQTATLDSTPPPAHSEQPSDTSLDSPETAPDVDVEEAFLQINANVTIPVVSVCIKDELGDEKAHGIVEMSLEQLSVKFERATPYISTIGLQISSLSVLDLLQKEDSKHRYIVLSLDKSVDRGNVPKFISTSLPNTPVKNRKRKLVAENESHSLPSSSSTESLKKVCKKRKFSMSFLHNPNPPGENLVTVDITFIDRNIPDFTTAHNSVNTSVDIDFNCLEIVLNQETWVMLLDFFGLGAKVFTPEQQHEANTVLQTQPPTEGLKANLFVKSFSLVLVKKNYDLAKANISKFQIEVIKQQKTTKFSGGLGSLRVEDLSPHGVLHSCKFTTASESSPDNFETNMKSALNFQVLKYDVPDEMLEREFDLAVDLNMSSVIYTHSKRFPIEMINFVQDFLEHHDSIGHMRAASNGQQVPVGPGHAPRIKLNIVAGTPIVILPGSSLSTKVIVMHLGNLFVSNTFLLAGEENTLAHKNQSGGPQGCESSTNSTYDPMTSSIYCTTDDTLESTLGQNASRQSQPCLLDVMSVRLSEMDIYSACRVDDRLSASSTLTQNSDIQLKGYHYKMDKNRPLKERCVLDLIIERNLDNDLSHSSPEIAIQGILSSVYCHLDVEQYTLVRAVLDQNLGEDLTDLQRVARQLPHIQTILSGNVWTALDMSVDLNNVTIELLYQHQTSDSPPDSLARLDFITSKLTFVSYSNQSRDVDLVSQEIRVTDTREGGLSLFKHILQPTVGEVDQTLHMEIHMRSSRAKNCVSVLFNNMRIFCVLDWLAALSRYLGNSPEKQMVKSTPRVSQTVAPSLASLALEENAEDAKLELKLNLTDTELVLVEDVSRNNSSSIILKTTAICHYQPYNESRPVICNLQKMELFSCSMCAESSTALSIIDPFDVMIELVKRESAAQDSSHLSYQLEVGVSVLCVRFSYSDLLLFQRILNSQQFNLVLSDKTSSSDQKLTQAKDDAESTSSLMAAVSSMEVNTDRLSLCLINDCADMDIPLFELHLNELQFNQRIGNATHSDTSIGQVSFEEPIAGTLSLKFGLDYYNRLLSGWEPMVEPWMMNISWDGNLMSNENVDVKVRTTDVVNLNVTSAVLDMMQQMNQIWSSLPGSSDGSSSASPITSNRESFVPYSLKNQTGRTLLFAIVTKTDGTVSLPTSWCEVLHGQTKPFSCISSQNKQRHQDTHESTDHRLVVMVEGWQKTSAISIDKVGLFFRTIFTDEHSKSVPKIVASRIVFDIKCMENASKCITVKSPITLRNYTSQDIEMRMESILDSGAAYTTVLPANTSQPLPLAFLFSCLWFRPAGNEMLTYTNSPISCQSMKLEKGGVKSTSLVSDSLLDSAQSFRLSAVVKKEPYPEEAVMETLGPNTLYQPGHTVTLLPPLTIVNLLPVDLGYLVNHSTHSGKLRPGKEVVLHQVNVSNSLKLDLAADGYHKGGALNINSSASDHVLNVRVYDASDRLLLLEARITRQAVGSVKVVISVKYWMINHTGLPLVFKQVGAKSTSSGQFEENEIARSMAPLMFSFSENEQPDLCSMRLGTVVHPTSKPSWCHRFSLDNGNHVRRLRVARSDGRPEWVYNIGIEVNKAVRKYEDTTMVTLVPYNKVINKSSHRIAFTQKVFTQSDNNSTFHASLPGASHAYHWPRHDLDQLLCIKILDVPSTLWSGGFRIDQLNSIVINIRNSENSDCILMKIETVLQGSTFTTIIADASDIPPPLKIENYTDLSLKFWQTNITDEAFRTTVKPKSCVAYAWDEPTMASTITSSIHCDMGSSENVYDMNVIGQAENLEYENCFYIALTHSPDSLVLDVTGGTGILFARREPGRRSQLWSHNVEGRLVHEGNRASKQLYKEKEAKYCLDIAELAVIAQGYSCLSLRKVDSRRQTTQLWKFLETGQLTCGIKGQCVQSVPAFGGMVAGARVALGPYSINQVAGVEMNMSMSKMLPGSGVLSVGVYTDGPTRVLRVVDILDIEKIKYIRLNSGSQYEVSEREERVSSRQMSLQVALPALGLSLVNQVREELLYLSLVKPLFDYIRSENIENIHLSIRHVQLDNQLVDTTFPITIYSQTNKQRAQSSKARAAAVDVDCQHVLGSNSSMHVFKLLTVQMAPFSLDIDEILLMKVIEMFTANRNKEEESELSVIQPSKDKDFDISVRKYYFALLSVVCGQMTLSVHTAKLPQHLKDVKKAMAMSSMITFENAVIDFEPFLQLHPFESLNFMLTAIGTHFKQELQGQAAKIFGAVDVLGNPLGLVNDVTTGISGLVTDGNVGMLLKNVTHGASNSLAKVAGTLSQGLGRISMDANHEEHRDQIRRQYAGSNVLLGFKSLAHGIIGGITSLAQQTLEGASQDGLEGMFTGFGKGVVGTVTKPVVGVLDFASGAATAIRDTSGGGGGIHTIQRKRKPRCCYSRHGLLPVYSSRSATGQQVLLFLNGDSKTQERYIDHIRLTNQPEPHHILVSDQAVYLLNMNRPQEEPSLLVSLSDLLSCIYVRKERADGSIQHYIEVKWKRLSESGGSHYKTSTSTVRCETSEVAEQVVILIDHARGLYNEKLHTVLAT